jgi:hypothetical protein
MLVIFMDIFISVRIRKRAVIQPAQFQHGDNRTNHQKHLQLQMLILMLTRASIFLITTLPLAIYKITAPREANFTTSIFRIASIWTGLTWFQSLNYAVSISLLHDFHFFSFSLDKLLQSLSYFNIISQRI